MYGDNMEASLQTKNGEISSALIDFFVFRLAIINFMWDWWVKIN